MSSRARSGACTARPTAGASVCVPRSQSSTLEVWTEDVEVGVDLPPFLRQTVKTQNPMNGESSHGFVTQAVHQGIQAGRGSAAGGRGIAGRGCTGVGGQPARVATLAA